MEDECKYIMSHIINFNLEKIIMEIKLSAEIHSAKIIIDTLDVADLRTIEDYAQLRRIRLQENRVHSLMGVDYICPF